MSEKAITEGKSKQLTDSSGELASIWLRSYFETAQGIISVESEDPNTGINLDFDFSRSKNIRSARVLWAGCEKLHQGSQLKSIVLNVAPNNHAHILIDSDSAFQGMLVSYGYAYKMMHL